MRDLVFDPVEHVYTLRGRRLPSVTQVLSILQDWSAVDPELLANAAEFGTHVHQAVDLVNRGQLDWTALDPALRPFVDSWVSWVHDTDATVLHTELRLAHPSFGYAGTLDALVRIKNRLCIVDVKTGQVPHTVGAQLAAYARAFEFNAKDLGLAPDVRRRLCVQLTADGYKSHELTDPSDWSLFQSALNVYRYKHH